MSKKKPKPTKGEFLKTDVPCLYRYSSTGVYFALLKHEGKQNRKSLKTTDKAEAKRKLMDERRALGLVDHSKGRMTLKELCDSYLGTVKDQAPKTVERKEAIVKRLLEDFPKGKSCQIDKIRKSDLETWLASYEFGYASHTLYVHLLKALFEMAVNDRLLLESPAANIKPKKLVKPIRLTPSFEEFQSIIHSVRQQRFNADSKDSADLLEFMGMMGVGQAEAGGMLRQHVNLKRKQITFFRHKTKTPFTVPMFPQAEDLVTRLVERDGLKPEDAVFPIKDAKKALAAACKRLNLPAYSQRALRRMFITRCIEHGVDVRTIADWQGHRDGGKLILGTYSHVRNTHAEEMAKKLQLPVAAAPQDRPSVPDKKTEDSAG